MSPALSYFWYEMLLPALNAFALTGSLIGLVIGVGLLVALDDTLAFFRRMNRRVSLRRATRPLEVPHSIEGPATRRPPALGAAFLVGGAYAAAALSLQFDTAQTVSAMRLASGAALAQVLVEAARWFLVIGGCAAAILGLLILLRPQAWVALEARANEWKSTRQMMRAADEPNDLLDRLVERFPRQAGVLLTVTSLVASAAFAFLLFR
ncbi:MAG: hypothetical protein ACM30H_08745 [Clostridia bacterium]